MPQTTLQQIARITNGVLHGTSRLVINTIEIDSRSINRFPNSLFVAIKGERHDGHNYLVDLHKSGVNSFLIENTSCITGDLRTCNFILVQNTVDALHALAAWYRKTLDMPVVGITGSNGKTVVKEWLFHCLSETSKVSRSPKSYNSQVGVPLSVWMLEENANWALIEAGISRPGEMQKLEKIIQPDCCIITNIGQAHQKNFSSLEQKTEEKLLLCQHAKVVYYCHDHEIIRKGLIKNKARFNNQLICWSRKKTNCFLFLEDIQKGEKETSLLVKIDKLRYKLSIPFTDDASIENCLHIVTFLFHNNQKPETIQSALLQLTPVAMRLEQVKGINHCTLINDSYNSDINSLRIALDYLAIQKQHAKHTLILSDINQAGQNPEALYTQVRQLTDSRQIDQFIAIGKEISGFGYLHKNTLKYPDTETFLKSLDPFQFKDRAILIKGARAFRFEKIVSALSEKKHTTVLEINLNNLVSNLNYYRGLLPVSTKIMVMVKALAYGSGSYEIANLLQHEKIDYLGVAFTDEGISLRKAGITLPILVMAPSVWDFDSLIEHKLEPEIFSFRSLKAFSKAVSANRLKEYPVHLKLDTGMHRLGFMENDIPALNKYLTQQHNLRIKALFSHLAVSDNPEEDAFSRQQIENMQKMSGLISRHLGYKPLQHLLNSSGIERFPEACFDMVRLGIGLHGVSGKNEKLYPVSTLKTEIVQIKAVPKSATVGYNRSGTLERDSLIAVIPVGYADGLNRKLGNRNGQVVIRSKKADFIGNICMDMSMIDVTDIEAREGDEVIVFGRENPVQQLAEKTDTIPYEILTSISSRVKRVYVNE